MTPSRRVGRVAAVILATALVVVVLPVEQVVADEIAPETKSADVDDIAVESSEVLPDPETGSAADESSERSSDAEELPDGGSEGQAEDPPAADGTANQVGESEEASESDAASEPTTVRERSEVIEAPIPFTGLGFRGDGTEAPEIHWRALLDDGEWSPWNLVEVLDGFDGPDPGSLEGRAVAEMPDRWVSDAIWVGAATHLQIQVVGAELSDLDVTVIDSAGLSESLFAKAKRTVMSLGTPEPAEATSGPHIRRRADWGANESCTKGTIEYATPRAAVIHHTVTKSDYTRDEVPQQIRNMYHWHTSCSGIKGNGWNDIGYNFVIDRFGRIWEGRRGGIDRGVIGAHAGGWNTGTFGVAFMGNHNLVVPSQASLDAAAELVAWKFDIHGIDNRASATTSLRSQTVPTLFGHRNVRGSYTANPSTTTDCPGQHVYVRLGQIRDAVAIGGDPWTPVVGDWNGNGQTTVGWYRDGEWRLRNFNSGGSDSLSFRFGRVGDLPVVGDWNGDGRTTVGVVRGSQWLLTNRNRGGAADISFHYGRGAIDFPMAGDWNGNGRSSPAIVRDGEWHLRNSLSGGPGQIVFTYGRITRGDLPVVGDWNGNGRDTPGILRRGEWHLRNAHAGGPADFTFIYGRLRQGDTPIVGDWSGNGATTVGITRGGEWHLRNHLSGGPANVTFTYR